MLKRGITCALAMALTLGCSPAVMQPPVEETPPEVEIEKRDVQSDVNWLLFEDAVAAAHQFDRTLLIYFYADWCPYCTLMKSVWKDPAVIKYINESFISVREDVEDSVIASAFKIEGVPQIVIADVKRSVSVRIRGYGEPHDLLRALKESLEKLEKHRESQ